MEKINGRENLLAIFRHEKPKRLPRPADTCTMRFPGDQSTTDEAGNDWWGVRWVPVPYAGQMIDEKQKPILSDLTKWREQIQVPDPYVMCDWERVSRAGSAHWNRGEQMGTLILLEGHFERMHSLMGFEDALCAFYDEDAQESIKELFAAITDYKFKCLDIAKHYYNPDVIIYHDDWGTNRSMFFNPEIWHTYIKPEFKKIVDETHRLGMRFELHSCGHIQEVIGPLVEEIGIDSIQTLQYPQNDIRMIKKNWGDRLVTRGGYDGQLILRDDVTDDEIRAAVRESISVLAPGGNHIPYFYSLLGKDTSHAVEVFYDEVDRYEKEFGAC